MSEGANSIELLPSPTPSHCAYQASNFSGSGDLKNNPPRPSTFAIFQTSTEFDFGAHRTGALVTCSQGDAISCPPSHHPLNLRTVVRDMVVRPERNSGVLVRLALELADILAWLAGQQRGPVGEFDVDHDATNNLAL